LCWVLTRMSSTFSSACFAGEAHGVVAQEDEASDVFQDLRFGVAAQLLLAHQRADAGDSLLVVAAGRRSGRSTRLSTKPSTCASRRGNTARPSAGETLTFSLADEDDPDPVIDGKIDLGSLTAEVFALGLDPYPRKPGVELVAPAEQALADSPFAALAAKRSKR
jgi:hypothetical protein